MMDVDGDSEWDGSVGFVRHIAPEVSETEVDLVDCVHSQAVTVSETSKHQLESSDSETDLESDFTDEDAGSFNIAKGQLENSYRKVCLKFGIIPCSPFLRHICDEEIDLSHYNIGPLGAKAIARTLKENTTTILLNVHDNGIGVDGAKAFAEMLASNCFITMLDLSMNFIGEGGFEAMSRVLKSNKYIIELNFASTKLNDAAAVFVGGFMEENETLRSLDLNSNEIGDEGCIHIAKGIKSNSSIMFLNLGCNHIRGKGGIAVANALISNSALKTIDLQSNGFADVGTRAVGNALKVNHSLREIDLSQNRITPEGAWALAIGLEENVGLKVLKIGGNPFQSRGAKSIVDALITNKETAMEELYFDDVIVSGDFESLLVELLEQREGLFVQFGTIVKGKEHKRRGPQQKVMSLHVRLNLFSFALVDGAKGLR